MPPFTIWMNHDCGFVTFFNAMVSVNANVWKLGWDDGRWSEIGWWSLSLRDVSLLVPSDIQKKPGYSVECSFVLRFPVKHLWNMNLNESRNEWSSVTRFLAMTVLSLVNFMSPLAVWWIQPVPLLKRVEGRVEILYRDSFIGTWDSLLYLNSS